MVPLINGLFLKGYVSGVESEPKSFSSAYRHSRNGSALPARDAYMLSKKPLNHSILQTMKPSFSRRPKGSQHGTSLVSNQLCEESNNKQV